MRLSSRHVHRRVNHSSKRRGVSFVPMLLLLCAMSAGWMAPCMASDDGFDVTASGGDDASVSFIVIDFLDPRQAWTGVILWPFIALPLLIVFLWLVRKCFQAIMQTMDEVSPRLRPVWSAIVKQLRILALRNHPLAEYYVLLNARKRSWAEWRTRLNEDDNRLTFAIKLTQNKPKSLPAPSWMNLRYRVDEQVWDGLIPGAIDLWLVVCNTTYFRTFCRKTTGSAGAARLANMIDQSPILSTYSQCWKRYLRELLVWEEALDDGEVSLNDLPRYITDVINWLPSIVLHITDPDGDIQPALIRLLSRIVGNKTPRASGSSRLDWMVTSIGHSILSADDHHLSTPPVESDLCDTIARLLVKGLKENGVMIIPVDLQRVTEASAYIACHYVISERLGVRLPSSCKTQQIEKHLIPLTKDTMKLMQYWIVYKAVSLLGSDVPSTHKTAMIDAIDSRLRQQ